MTAAGIIEQSERAPAKAAKVDLRPVYGEPPHDLDAEIAILGTVMESQDALAVVAGSGLEPMHFYAEGHRWIYEAAFTLMNAGKTVDVVAVTGWLRDRNRIASVGGVADLAEAIASAPFVLHVEEHAQRVMGLARVRELIVTLRRLESEAFRVRGDAQVFLDEAEHAVYQLSRTESRSDIVPIRDAVAESRLQIEAASRRDGKVELPIGLTALDRRLGLRRQEVTVLAARPGMGKTSLALAAALNLAGFGHPVAIFSLEMPRAQITTRMCCMKAEINSTRALRGMLDDVEWRQLSAAQAYVSKLPIYIDDTPGLSLMQLRAKTRRVRAKAGKPLGLVVIDYLQLMDGGRQRGQSRDEEVGGLTKGIKTLSREIDVPILELAQLNREVEKRQDKRPMLSDLRESGSVEQDADNVLFIYRDDYYHEESKWKGTSELIIGKQRSGPLGKVRVNFDGPTTTFSDITGPNAHEDEDDE